MATVEEYALMASDVYFRRSVNRLPVPAGWTLVETRQLADGFSAGVFISVSQIVISYTGTDFDDLTARALDFANGNIPAAFGNAASQVLDAAQLYFDVKQAYGNDITFTGHSLGGGLADLMAIYFNRPAVVFDPAPFGQSTTSLSVYASLQALNLLQPQSDPELSSFIPLISPITRSGNVESIYVKGEILSANAALLGLLGATPAVAGSSVALDPKATSDVNSTSLHSMTLLAGYLLSDEFLAVCVKQPHLLPEIFNTNLYAQESMESPTLSFLEKVVTEQAEGAGTLDLFSADIDLISKGGLVQGVKQINIGLIQTAIQYYYFRDSPNEGLFDEVTAGIRLNLMDVSNSADSIKGYSLFANWVRDTYTGGPDAPSSLPLAGRNTWYFWSGNGGMDVASDDFGNTHDVMLGGDSADVMEAGLGDDIVIGGFGDDTLSGADGDDILLGGFGADDLDGGAGDDQIWGGFDDDSIDGGEGNDTAYGGAGDDVVDGGDGNDFVGGGDGEDMLAGGEGNDTLDGGVGDDGLSGNDGADHLVGGIGDDTLDGGLGSDLLDGGADDDILSGGDGVDFLDGGGGGDDLDGGEGTDTLEGDTGDDDLDGGGGSDTLAGGVGFDSYFFESGAFDTIFDLDGDGMVFFNNEVLTGGKGEDEDEDGQVDNGLYISEDGRFTYHWASGVLSVNGTLAIQNFDNGDLGIELEEPDDNDDDGDGDDDGDDGDDGDTDPDLDGNGIPDENEPGDGDQRPDTNMGELPGDLDDDDDDEGDPGTGIGGALEDFLNAMGIVAVNPFGYSPLMLDLNGDGVQTLAAKDGAHFDHDANGFAEQTGWVSPDDGLLVLDRNDNGRIDSGRELFGNQTLLPDLDHAANGFEALAVLDVNGDGTIDASDAAFADLKVWKDANGDGYSSTNELYSLSDLGIRSIDLGYTVSDFVDSHGNAHRQVGSFTRTDGSTATVTDVWVDRDVVNTVADTRVDVSMAIAGLPDIQGSGNVYTLHQAMARDATLQGLVRSFVIESNAQTRDALLDQIMFRWAGVDGVDPGARGSGVDARKLGVLEQFLGQSYSGFYGPNPWIYPAGLVTAGYESLSEKVYAELMAETRLRPLYRSITYYWDDSTQSVKGDLSGVFAKLEDEYALDPDKALSDFKEFARTVAGYGAVDLLSFDQITVPSQFLDATGRLAAGGNLVLGGSTGDSIEGGTANDVILGESGDDTITDLGGVNRIYGGLGDDFIKVIQPEIFPQNTSWTDRSDVLVGGKGNDTMEGGGEFDTYVFNRGDGQDTILDNSTIQYYFWNIWGQQFVEPQDSAEADTLQLGPGIRASDLVARIVGNDLALTIGDSANLNPDPAGVDRITLKDWALGTNHWIENIQFADGSALNSTDLNILAETGTDGNDVMSGFLGLGLSYHALGGDDTISGDVANDTIDGGAGNDSITDIGGTNTIDGGNGNDTINVSQTVAWSTGIETVLGGAGDDLIEVGQQPLYLYYGGVSWGQMFSATITGGTGNDALKGGAESDTYVFNRGDGRDTIADDSVGTFMSPWYWTPTYVTDSGEPDTLRFGAGISASDISGRVLGNDLVLTVNDPVNPDPTTPDQITLKDWALGTNHWIENIQFADGSALNSTDLNILAETGTDGNDVMSGFLGLGLSYHALGGDDTISGDVANDTIDGGAGNDSITDIGGTNTIDGGNGNDTINVSQTVAWSTGIETVLGGAGDDLIEVGQQPLYLYYGGVSWGQMFSATITGGTGNDALKGGAESDTYVFNRGDGRDTIADDSVGTFMSPWYWTPTYVTDSGEPDTLRFGAGISASDISGRVLGNDLVLTVNDPVNPDPTTPDQITLKDWALGTNHWIESVQFADGTVLGASDVQIDDASNNLLAGTQADSLLFADAGNDVLQGGGGNDILNDASGNNLLDSGAGNDWLTGGAGNDLLMGRAGNDTLKTGMGADVIAFNAGDGNDSVDETEGGNHAISLGGGIIYESLTLGKQDNDLVVGTGNGESITLKNWYASPANHTVLNLQVVAEAMAGYDASSSDPLLNKKVETFDFAGLVGEFDDARAADTGLTSWALTNGLTQFHLSGSDDAALGGDLAYQYGMNGTLAGIGLDKAQDVLTAATFDTQAQTLRPLATLQDGFVQLS